MMHCPACGSDTRVRSTWKVAKGHGRSRVCTDAACAQKFVTHEVEKPSPTLTAAFATRRKAQDAKMLANQEAAMKQVTEGGHK